MPVVFIKKSGLGVNSASLTTHKVKGKVGHAKCLPFDRADLWKPGRLKPGHLMSLFEISHSTLYVRRAEGIIPPPDLVEKNRPIWFTSTIAPFFGIKAT